MQPGVVNLDITLAVQALGYFYAPDPSSQRACTIGGNVAENSGGPHTLAYGVTTNHVLGLEFVLPDGTIHTTGGKEPDRPGYDLTGPADRLGRHHGAGDEDHRAADAAAGKGEDHAGHLRLTRRDCADTVAEITARAITPVAVEMLDGEMLRMVEEATHAGYPMDAAAVLLIELEGLTEAVEEQAEQIREVCERCGAREFRVAKIGGRARPAVEGPQERVRRGGPREPVVLRAGWRGAADADRAHAALHRGSRRAAPGCASAISSTRATATCTRSFCSTARMPGELERAKAAGEDILHYCIDAGRLHHRRAWRRHGEERADAQAFLARNRWTISAGLKHLFDPESRLNPGKVLPTGQGCAEVRQAALTPRNMV